MIWLMLYGLVFGACLLYEAATNYKHSAWIVVAIAAFEALVLFIIATVVITLVGIIV